MLTSLRADRMSFYARKTLVDNSVNIVVMCLPLRAGHLIFSARKTIIGNFVNAEAVEVRVD